MPELQKGFNILFDVAYDKRMRIVIHHREQFTRFADYRTTLTPRQYRRKESRDFYILFLLKKVRYRNRIVRYEFGPVILIGLFFQELVQCLACKSSPCHAPATLERKSVV